LTKKKGLHKSEVVHPDSQSKGMMIFMSPCVTLHNLLFCFVLYSFAFLLLRVFVSLPMNLYVSLHGWFFALMA